MSGTPLTTYAEREFKYQVRREISNQIRKQCPKGDPFVTGVTVMLGTVLVLAVLNEILNGKDQGRTR